MLLDALIIPLKMDSSDFSAGADKAEAKSQTLASKLGGIGSKAITAGIAAVGAAIAGVTTAAVAATKATTEWALELDGIQDVMGGSTETAAAYNYILRKSGTDTEAFNKAIVMLTKDLVDQNGELSAGGKALEAWGISLHDANGNLKDQNTLMQEVAAKYGSLNTQQERLNLLTDLFGSKNGPGLIDFFDTMANEGGIDKTTEKVKSLGLVIDPAKYEEFGRLWEEIKLALLGVGVTIVDTLMPSVEDVSEWWQNDGLPAFQEAVKWLDENLPAAIDDTKRSWEGLTATYNTRVAPVVRELNRLFTNMNSILEKLDPSTDKLAGKFTLLGVTQRVAIAWATIVNTELAKVQMWLDSINRVLEQGIYLWNTYFGNANAASSISVPTSSGGQAGGGVHNRASGGPMIGGQSYNVVEFFRPEVFTPNTSGRMDPMRQSQSEPFPIDELVERLTRGLAQEIIKARA